MDNWLEIYKTCKTSTAFISNITHIALYQRYVWWKYFVLVCLVWVTVFIVQSSHWLLFLLTILLIPRNFAFKWAWECFLKKKNKNRRTTMVIKNIAPKRKRKQFLLELSTNFAFAFWNWQTAKIFLVLEMEKIKSFVDWNWKMNFFPRQKWNRFR